jgi:hypothetical protein
MTQRLLVTPPPLPQEALLSWLSRLATENGFASIRGMVAASPLPVNQQRISRFSHPELFAWARDATGLPPELLSGIRADGYAAELGERPTRGRWRWRLPYTGGRSDAQRFVVCVECLRENRDAPYWKEHWWTATATVCEVHGCMLVDECPRCSTPVALATAGRVDFVRCTCCGVCFWGACLARHDVRPSWPAVGFIHVDAPAGAIAAERAFWDNLSNMLRLICVRRTLRALASCLAVPGWARDACARLLTSGPELCEAMAVEHRHELLAFTHWLCNTAPGPLSEWLTRRTVEQPNTRTRENRQ